MNGPNHRQFVSFIVLWLNTLVAACDDSSTRLERPEIYKGIKVADIKDLVEPVSANENLQELALEQVQFEKQLRKKNRNKTEKF